MAGKLYKKKTAVLIIDSRAVTLLKESHRTYIIPKEILRKHSAFG